MRRVRHLGMLLLGAALVVPCVSADIADEMARVVVVANERDPDSVALAKYYVAARGIPEGNLVALPMPADEGIDWPGFIEQVLDPLRGRLVATGWLEAITSSLKDEFGRQRFVCTESRISYLVLVRGVPLRIEQYAPWASSAAKNLKVPGTVENSASVDSELAVMCFGNTPVNGQIPNPLFRRLPEDPVIGPPVVRVVRLDGPNVQAVRDMIDNAIAAEKSGIAGRAYIDESGWHPEGDRWLEGDYKALAEAGFDVDVDRQKDTFPANARFDAPAIYLGWYDWNISGPMNIPGFRFPVGAIAVHIQSYSADTLRSDSKNWCGPLIARGVTATLGNVHEPYLQWTNQLDLLLEALMQGRSWGDACYSSIPVLSWQPVFLGDPLYRPFAVSLEDQWADRAKVPAELQTALYARKIHLLIRDGAKDDAMSLARARFRDAPSIASGLLLAETTATVQGDSAAPQHLKFLSTLDHVAPKEIGVALRAARELSAWGAHAQAFEVYRRILTAPVPVWAGEQELIEEALREANSADSSDGVAELEARLSRLKTVEEGERSDR